MGPGCCERGFIYPDEGRDTEPCCPVVNPQESYLSADTRTVFREPVWPSGKALGW